MGVDVAVAEADAGTPAPRQGLAFATFEATAFRFGALPFSFATTIITSRILLPTGRAYFVLALLTVTLAWVLLCHVMVGVTREIGHVGTPPSAALTQGIVLALVLGAIGVATLLPLDLVLASGPERIVAITTLALPAMLITSNVGGALVALGRQRAWNLLQLLPQVFVVVGMAILVVALGKHLTGAVAAWVGAQLAVGAIALFLARDLWLEAVRTGTWRSPNRMRPMLRLGLAMGVVNVVGVLNYRVELFVLQAFRGLNSVGIYSVAASLAELAWLPVAALAAVATPAIVSSAPEAAADALARAFRHTVVLTLGFTIVLGTAGILLIPIVFGDRFADARTPLAILLPAIVVFAPTKILAVYLSSRLGRPGFQFAVAAVSTVLTATSAALLVPRLGMSGAALSTCAGYLVGVGLEIALMPRFGVPVSAFVPRIDDLRAYRSALVDAKSRLSALAAGRGRPQRFRPN